MNVTTSTASSLANVRFFPPVRRRRNYWIYFSGGPLDGKESIYETKLSFENWETFSVPDFSGERFALQVYRVCNDGGNRVVMVYDKKRRRYP